MERIALYLLPVAILAIVVLTLRLSSACKVREGFKEGKKRYASAKGAKAAADDGDRPKFHDVLYGYKVAFADGVGPNQWQSGHTPVGPSAPVVPGAPVAPVPVAPMSPVAPGAPVAPLPTVPKEPKAPAGVTTKNPSSSTTQTPRKTKVDSSSKKCNDWIMSVKRGSPNDKMLNKDRSTTNFLVHNTKLNPSGGGGGDGDSVWKWMTREVPACQDLEWQQEYQDTYDQHMKSVGMLPKKPDANQKSACMTYITDKYAAAGRDTTDHNFKLDYKWPKTGYTEWDYISSTVSECKDLQYDPEYQTALDKARAQQPVATPTTPVPTTPVPATTSPPEKAPEPTCNPDMCLHLVHDGMDVGSEIDTGGRPYPRCAGCPYVKAIKNGRNWDARIARTEVAVNKNLTDAKDIIRVKFCEYLNNTTARVCKDPPSLEEPVAPAPTKPRCPDCAQVITDWMKSAMASARKMLAENPAPFTNGTFVFDWDSVPSNCCKGFVRNNKLIYKIVIFKVKDMPGYEYSVEKIRSFLKFYAESLDEVTYVVGMWVVEFGGYGTISTHPYYSSATYMHDMSKTYNNVLAALKLTGKVYDSNELTTFYLNDGQPHEWGGNESGAGDLGAWKGVQALGGTTNGVPVGIYKTVDDNSQYSDISLLTVPLSHAVLCLHPDPENTPNMRLFANTENEMFEAHHLSEYSRNEFLFTGKVCFGDPNQVFNDNVAYAIVFPHEAPAILREDPDHDEVFVATKNICKNRCDCDGLTQFMSTVGRLGKKGADAIGAAAPGIVQQANQITQQGITFAGDLTQQGITFGGDLTQLGISVAGDLTQQGLSSASDLTQTAGDLAQQGVSNGGDLAEEAERSARDTGQSLGGAFGV